MEFSNFSSLALACLLALALTLPSHAQNSPRDYLNAHNAARAAVNVGPMTWDNTVATYARNYANQRIGDCKLVHSGGRYGENIAWGSADLSGTAAVRMWVNERTSYNYGSNTCAPGKVCGHYTQVVWRDSVRLGVCSEEGYMANAAVLVLLAALVAQACADIKVQSVERKINLNSQFGRITESYKLKNTGGGAADRVVLCQAQQPGGHLALHKVSQVLSSKVRLQVTSVAPAGMPSEALCWEVQLSQPIPAGETGAVDSAAIWVDVQSAYPAEVSQGEQQLLRYHDNVYVPSPYTISTQTTEVVLPSSRVKSYTDSEKPVTKTDNKIKYGKYDLVKPWSVQPLQVHFESSKQFKKVLSLVREIEVSHWGNIYVEETYELTNAGAKHKGAFSRLKHSQLGGAGNSFQELKARLPAAAHSLYYVDTIGNISTSNVRKTGSETVLDFSARYPLLGGWKTDFTIGYSLPLQGFLHRVRGGKRRLTMDLSTPLEGVHVAQLTVKVVLPEGASHITTSLPHDNIQQARDVKFTYLDTTGRPVVLLQQAHLVPEHAAKFSVDYSFPAFGWMREPLMLIGAFLVLFAVAILYNRLEFTISRDDKWQAAQDVEKLATLMQAINSVMEEEDEVLESLTKLISSIRTADDAEYAIRERASLEASFTSLENKVKSLNTAVSAAQQRVGDKVLDIQNQLRGLEQRLTKQLTEKSDMAKKGVVASEMSQRQAATSKSIKEARTHLADRVESTFAPY